MSALIKSFKVAKDPDSDLDYYIDWGTRGWLGDDTIATSTWTVPTGLTGHDDSASTTLTTIWLSGGAVDTIYKVVNHIVTAAGREEDAELVVVMTNTF